MLRSPPPSTTFRSAKALSTYTIWRNTYEHGHSLENVFFTSTQMLSVWRGQSSYEGLPPLLGCPKVNHGTEREIDRRLNSSERHSGRRESVFHSRGDFCLAQLAKSAPQSLLVY